VRRDLLQRGSQAMLVVAGVSLFVAGVFLLWQLVFGRSRPIDAAARPLSSGEVSGRAHDPSRPLVGLVSGHSGYDPGAVCPDGLTEAELNAAVARRVVDLLARKGIQTDVLTEFDPRLPGYRADALVSIHADSCTVRGATGFKVARITLSAIPEAEDQLVNCLTGAYMQTTHLPEHPASITDGMTNYHAFREIASETPGAIIETGFMLEDRALLERRPQLVARGISEGILCFLETQGNAR